MRYSWRDVRFSPPSGFSDRTVYRYSSPNSEESLVLSLGTYSPSAPSFEAVVRNLRSDLETVAEEDAKVFEDRALTLADRPGWVLGFLLSDSGWKCRQWIAVAPTDRGGYLQLAYEPATPDPSSADTFHQIVANASLPGRPPPTPTPRGYLRRDLGAAAFDIPERLEGPRVFRFVGADGKLRLRVRFEDSRHSRTAPSVLAHARDDAEPGDVVTDLVTETISKGDARVEIGRFLVTHEGLAGITTELQRLAIFSFVNGVRALISARGPEGDLGSLEMAFVATVRSVHLAK